MGFQPWKTSCCLLVEIPICCRLWYHLFVPALGFWGSSLDLGLATLCCAWHIAFQPCNSTIVLLLLPETHTQMVSMATRDPGSRAQQEGLFLSDFQHWSSHHTVGRGAPFPSLALEWMHSQNVRTLVYQPHTSTFHLVICLNWHMCMSPHFCVLCSFEM